MSTEQNTPENPYPIEVFTMTNKEYVKAVPDEKLRTAISGCVGRHVWDVCCKQWLEQLRDAQPENTARFNEPIWDSRNSDEPRQPPPETIDEYCGQPPGSFKQFVKNHPNPDMIAFTPTPETGAVDVEKLPLNIANQLFDGDSPQGPNTISGATFVIREALKPLTTRIAFLEEQLRQHDTKH